MSRYWYRVEMLTGSETYCFFGSNELAEDAFIRAYQGGELLYLKDLIFYDEDEKVRSWSEWDPVYLSKVYLNPQYVVSIMPMAGDPRKLQTGGRKILTLPRGE